jgi:hypothetical protein
MFVLIYCKQGELWGELHPGVGKPCAASTIVIYKLDVSKQVAPPPPPRAPLGLHADRPSTHGPTPRDPRRHTREPAPGGSWGKAGRGRKSDKNGVRWVAAGGATSSAKVEAISVKTSRKLNRIMPSGSHFPLEIADFRVP